MPVPGKLLGRQCLGETVRHSLGIPFFGERAHSWFLQTPPIYNCLSTTSTVNLKSWDSHRLSIFSKRALLLSFHPTLKYYLWRPEAIYREAS
jgi:hypothetical protein